MDVILKDIDNDSVSIKLGNLPYSRTGSYDRILSLHSNIGQSDPIGFIPHNLRAIFDLNPVSSSMQLEQAIFIFEDPPMYRDILFKDGMKTDAGKPESYTIPLPWMYYIANISSYNGYTYQEVYVAFSVERITDWSDSAKAIHFNLPNLIHINNKVYFCLPDSFHETPTFESNDSIKTNEEIINLAHLGIRSYWSDIFNNNASDWLHYCTPLVESLGDVSHYRKPIMYLEKLQSMSIEQLLDFDHDLTNLSIESICCSVVHPGQADLLQGLMRGSDVNMSHSYVDALRSLYRSF